MTASLLQKLKPHLLVILIFFGIVFAYFSPVFQGKDIRQHDVIQGRSQGFEVDEFRKDTGEEALWTGSMFSGMPAFQISTTYSGNWLNHIYYKLRLGLSSTAMVVFYYLICFYILLIVLGVSPWLSAVGAVGFAFSSYYFLIIEAGHMWKAWAIAFMPLVLAGIMLVFQRKYLYGAALTALAVGLEIKANHFQMTYYSMFIIVPYVVSQFYVSLKDKEMPHFAKSIGVLAVAGIIGLGPNIASLWSTYEYSKETIRGASELSSGEEKASSGLDKEYALAWSYGKAETLTLLIPNLFGGASGHDVGKSSNMHEALIKNGVPAAQAANIVKQAPTYWGEQPFTGGPVYAGAILVFLFVLGLIIIKNPMKWWVLFSTVLVIMLSWGRHFEWFTDLFFYNFPMYNKFRAVASLLVIAEFLIPLFAIFTVHQIIEGKIEKEKLLNGLKISVGVVGGLALLIGIMPGMFLDFSGSQDDKLNGVYPAWLIEALMEDRQSMAVSDSFRSLFFIMAAGALLYFVVLKKLTTKMAIASLFALVLIDMWTVNKRFLNNDDFVPQRNIQNIYNPASHNLQILADTDPNFRVMDYSINTFNDATTSIYHKTIGGYHAAKLRRYQDLIEQHISKQNYKVFNMLNARYFIVPNRETNETMVQRNYEALGNAWFLNDIKWVENPDEEIAALNDFNPQYTAIIDMRFQPYMEAFKMEDVNPNQGNAITFEEYKPNYLKYTAKVSNTRLAVFSEIYYDKGWNAYLNGQKVEHIRCNYVLRAMAVPPGEHVIEFKFEPVSYFTGNKISLAFSVLLVLLVGGALFSALKPMFATNDENA